MLEFLLNTFVILFVVIDPIGVAPIFAALTHHESAVMRQRLALRGVALSAIILFVFMFAGQALLSALGIGLDAFKIAGGFLLFLLAIDMVVVRQSGLRTTTPGEQVEAERRRDISVFPLAIPLLAGPGAMTTLLLLINEADGRGGHLLVLATALLLVLILALLTLVFAGRILQLMGETGTNVISRVLGVLLAALAVQYMLDGLTSQFSAALAQP